MAIDPEKPHAFLSYTRFDDNYFNDGISWLRGKLEQAVQARTGTPFQIFQDVEDIELGERWENKLDQALEEAQLFIPILTPSFFQSDFCRREARAFLDYAARAGRDDLILPLYLIETPVLDLKELREADELASALSSRQHADWRGLEVDLQHDGTRSKMAVPIQNLSKAIAKAVVRNAPPVRVIETAPSDHPSATETEEPDISDAQSELADELDATKAELADLKQQHERERRYWDEKEQESEKAVEAALKEAEREQGEDAKKLRLLTNEKRALEDELKARDAQAEQLKTLEVENEHLRSLSEARSSEPDDSAVMSRWPHRRPIAIAAAIALMVGAGGALGLRNLSSSDRADQLLAELEATRMELAAAKTAIEGLSQEVAAGPLMPGDAFQDCDFCPEMVVIPAGTFMMGSPENEEDRFDDEGPQHEVTIGSPFAIGKHEVTFEEYDRFAKATERDLPNDEGWGRGRRPVINVSWDDAQAYCSWFGKQAGKPYRLPSEAEWEYAARAGTTTRYAFGDLLSKMQANFEHAVGKTTEVGSYQANDFGLFDMHGNVSEWAEDAYQDSYEGAPEDGSAWLGDGTNRVVRGGSWDRLAWSVRSAYRAGRESGNRYDNLGFRCAGVQES